MILLNWCDFTVKKTISNHKPSLPIAALYRRYLLFTIKKIILSIIIMSLPVYFFLLTFTKPRIHVENPVIDLGVFDENCKTKNISFEIINAGRGVLEIEEVMASCPCMEVQLEKNLLGKGEKTNLTAKVTPVKRPGPWNDDIVLRSNSSKTPVTILKVKAFVKLGCIVLPSRIEAGIHFGQSVEKEFDVLGPTDNDDFKVIDVYSSSSAISVTDFFEQNNNGQNRKIWRVKLVLSGIDGKTSLEGKITVCTSSQNKPEIKVPVRIKQISSIKTLPSALFIKRTTDKSEIEIFSEKEPFKIKRIISPEWINTRTILQDKNKCYIIVEKTEDIEYKEIYRGKIKVIFEKNNSLDIPVVLL